MADPYTDLATKLKYMNDGRYATDEAVQLQKDWNTANPNQQLGVAGQGRPDWMQRTGTWSAPGGAAFDPKLPVGPGAPVPPAPLAGLGTALNKPPDSIGPKPFATGVEQGPQAPQMTTGWWSPEDQARTDGTAPPTSRPAPAVPPAPPPAAAAPAAPPVTAPAPSLMIPPASTASAITTGAGSQPPPQTSTPTQGTPITSTLPSNGSYQAQAQKKGRALRTPPAVAGSALQGLASSGKPSY